MEGVEALGTALVFVLAGGWVTWLLLGTLVNRRRAAALSRWAHAQARSYGSKLYVRWITLAAFELTVPEARAPFRELSVTGFLQSREMPFVWLLNRVRRRGDLLIVRATLRRPPAWALEVFRPDSLLAGDARRAAEAAGWALEAGADGRLRAYGGAGAPARCERVLAALGDWAPHVDRLALRREPPHVILALAVEGVSLETAPELGPGLVRLADEASQA